MSSPINLTKFNLSSLPYVNTKILIIGKRMCGKTILAHDITDKLCNIQYKLSPNPENIKTTNGIPRGTIISMDSNAPKLYNMIPDVSYYNTYNNNDNEDIIKEFIKTQKKLIIQNREEQKNTNVDIQTNPNSLMLIEDQIYNKGNLGFKFILLNGLSYKTSLIITTQYLLPMPPSDRSNFDYIFIFPESVPENLDKLYKQFAGMFPDLETFTQTMNTYVTGYNCLVINTMSRSFKIEDMVFWYCAELNQ